MCIRSALPSSLWLNFRRALFSACVLKTLPALFLFIISSPATRRARVCERSATEPLPQSARRCGHSRPLRSLKGSRRGLVGNRAGRLRLSSTTLAWQRAVPAEFHARLLEPIRVWQPPGRRHLHKHLSRCFVLSSRDVEHASYAGCATVPSRSSCPPATRLVRG